MSKELQAILKQTPPATVKNINTVKYSVEPLERIVASIPLSLKIEIKKYIAEHPGETERTIVLRSLQKFGFSVSEQCIKDFRGRKS